MTARKDDAGKVRLDLLSPEAILLLGEVLTHGEKKYGAWNWAQGLAWMRVVAALLRHLFAWIRGERLDRESGLPHLAHVMCCAMFLVHFEATGTGTDDRRVTAINAASVEAIGG